MNRHMRQIKKNSAGFTLTELLMSVSISSLVLGAVLTTFIWCGRQATTASKTAWSQQAAMSTSAKLSMYIRNASKIINIDEEEGQWVELGFPDGSTGKLIFNNAVPDLRDGQLVLIRNDGSELIVSYGMTEIQESTGFTTPVFIKTHANALRIAYQLSGPSLIASRDANDGAYATAVRFGVCLRNSAN